MFVNRKFTTMPNPPTFNTWTIIFLFAAVQGIIISLILFFNGKASSRSQKIYLTILMLLFSLQIFEYVLWWTGYLVEWPHWMNSTGSFPFLFGPLLFFYFKSVFRSEGINRYKDWLHFIPSIVFIIAHLPQYALPGSIKISYIHGTLKNPGGFPWPWFNLIQLSLYAIICFYEYRHEAENTLEVKKWFRLILTLFSLYILAVMTYYALVKMPWFNPIWDYMISITCMIFIYAIAIYGYFNNKVFNGFDLMDNMSRSKYQNSVLKNDFGHQVLDKLNQLMNEEKLYVDDEINLDKLALRLEISRHQLSQVLNELAGMNFFEYINSRRIVEAKNLLTSTSKKELNIIEIAYKVGYSNKVTFNNTFKKYTGMTPSEYRSSSLIAFSGHILSIRDHRQSDK
ncbi:MAG: AraC family transcriptional regulator [Saprospiraceae bacterium]